MSERRLQDFAFDESPYERPNQKWVCGRLEEGRPCRVGPDGRGRCRATFECTPVRKGDRWECARPGQWGGPCEKGPLPDGTCCRPVPRCQPVRSIRAKRGRLVLAVAAFTAGLALLLLGGSHYPEIRRAVISPGPLSAGHGAISECAACHGASTFPDVRTAAGAGGSDAEAPGRTGFCLSCHRASGEDALRPHGRSPAGLEAAAEWMAPPEGEGGGLDPVLLLSRAGPGPPATAEGEVACATCHREHRGRDASLTRMDDVRCQACHSVKFSGFGEGHPALGGLPALDRLPYNFDHAAHEAEHFPEEDAEFSCAGCHEPAPDVGRMTVGDFDGMCADCHEDQIGRDGLPVLQLPGMDYEILAEEGVRIGAWPFDAGIDLTAPVFPVMRVLLAADTAVAPDLAAVSDAELFFLEGEDPETLEAAGEVAWGVKRLFHDLATGGRDAMERRWRRGLGLDEGLTGREVAALVDQREVAAPRGPEPEWLAVVRRARDEWLPGLSGELGRRREGRGVPLRVLEDYGFPESPSDRWLIDSFDFSIRYLPSDHADPFLRELVEASVRGADGSGPAADLFARLSDPDAPGRCARCHAVEEAAGDPEGMEWTEGRMDAPGGGERSLTVFDHGPHLVLGCADCHESDPEGRFEPVAKSTCASCHTEELATESCLNCHRYHADPFTTTAAHSTSSTTGGTP